MGLIQLDSVNVFSRAHFMPFFSRLGPYDRDALDSWLWGTGEMFEYWGHEASLIPADQHRLFRWQMERGANWKAMKRLKEQHPEYLVDVLRQVEERGPLQTKELDDPGQRQNREMWNWSHGKLALEVLFVEGKVTTAHRPNFTRMYDVPHRVIPSEHLDAPGLTREEAQTILLEQAARHMGVATADDLGDYYRIRMPEARPLIGAMVDRGDLVEVEVEGWDKPAFLTSRGEFVTQPEGHRASVTLRQSDLVPAAGGADLGLPLPHRDLRARGEADLWVLRAPVPARRLTSSPRVDLKTDRQAGLLRVKGAFAEPGVDKVAVGRALREELDLVAAWEGHGRRRDRQERRPFTLPLTVLCVAPTDRGR